MRAFDEARYAEAARQFFSAASARSDTGNLINVGPRSEPYLPWYFLGLARARLGDIAGALNAFDRADQAGAIRRYPAYAERMSTLRADLTARLTSASPRDLPRSSTRGAPSTSAAPHPSPAPPVPPPPPPPTTAPRAPDATTADRQALYKSQQFENGDLGTVAFAPAKGEMLVGETMEVTAIVSPSTSLAAVEEQLRKISRQTGPAVAEPIAIYRRMEAHLTSDERIKVTAAHADAVQSVRSDSGATWKWIVEALGPGDHVLYLSVQGLISFDGEVEPIERRFIDTYQRSIVVRVPPAPPLSRWQRTTTLVRDQLDWKWLWGAWIVPLWMGRKNLSQWIRRTLSRKVAHRGRRA